MAKNSISKISNAFSTGGGGVNFEQQIQAMFLLSLLVEGFCPAMNEQTKRVCFQAKHLGYDVDDLVVFTYRDQTEGKMLCQIKHSITVTEKDKIFQEVICAAWSDFNKEEFDKENDRIALVTAQISNNAQQSLRFLHAQAIGSVDERDFIERINTRNFSNTDYIKMLTIIKECISAAQDCEPTNREIWSFCKAFILLLFDMDCWESVNRALSASLIKCNSSMDATLVWSRLVEYAGSCNQSAASINKENSDKSIQELFSENKIIQILPTPITGIDLFIPTVQFKITPGTDEDGNFDEEKFDFWMKTVKTWSQEKDRYEVTMHTVGSGLSYTPLDENKLPAKAIINELNKVKNSELRRGYYLGIINQRGVHFIDSEGKPEFELSEDYANRANIVEAMGYARYAEVLREIAEQYNREARRNISEAQNEKDNI